MLEINDNMFISCLSLDNMYCVERSKGNLQIIDKYRITSVLKVKAVNIATVLQRVQFWTTDTSNNVC